MTSPTLAATCFAVFDVETTGLSPAHGDRVVEISIALVRGDGEWLDELTTLVQPGRDPGPTHVHGLTAADLVDAPTFPEIAGDVSRIMEGAVLVGHNVHFDLRFLRSEFELAGHQLPELEHVCTVSLARSIGIGPPRSLSDCCHQLGVELENAHSARDDVRATAGLLFRMIDRGARPLELRRRSAGAQPATRWPQLTPSGRVTPRPTPA